MKKARQLLLYIVFCALVMNCMTALAAGDQTSLSLPSGAAVDQQTGSFSFDIRIDAPSKYAGMEFGVYCSEGCRITSVSYDVEASSTGPKEANGLTWFGFFDGEDSFSGPVTVSVQGTCEIGKDGAVAVRDVKEYTIGNGEYVSRVLESGHVVNLNQDGTSQQPGDQEDEAGGQQAEVASPKTGDDINVKWVIGGCLVIAAAIAAALIYIVRKKSDKV